MIRYIDLFCGLGAFHTAFEDFECVLACDIDPGIRKIYEANYGLKPFGDIRSLCEIPDFDILCAGFPCQPFSIAGDGAGFNDAEKGNLFYDIMKIVDRKKPRMCILENVKNLKTHDSGKTYRTIEKELTARGYTVTSRVLNAVDFGSPQCRQRIFIVATLGTPFEIPKGGGVVKTVESILNLENDQNELDGSKYSLVEKKIGKPGKTPVIVYDVISKKTGKGGRQGERVYDIKSPGITVCASSGGPGAKTGLYRVGDSIRRLDVPETLGMFGFPKTYNFAGVPDEKCRFYLGNSIVVNVVRSFVPLIKQWFG